MAKHGDFFWCDVMTTDTQAAGAFYSQVVGWGVTEADPGSGMEYHLFTVEGQGVAGLMPIPERAGDARPCWMSYIAVDDVVEAVAKVEREGGHVHQPPVEVPGIIRFAVVADPQGAVFLVAKPIRDEPMPEIAPRTQGTVGWHELYAGDWQAVFPFYETMFGWTKAQAMDMGDMGTYQLFANGGEPVGGMMTKSPQMPVPYWGVYFNVVAIDDAVERVKSAGGQVLMGPTAVPGDDWIVQCLDPQGAFFALVGRR